MGSTMQSANTALPIKANAAINAQGDGVRKMIPDIKPMVDAGFMEDMQAWQHATLLSVHLPKSTASVTARLNRHHHEAIHAAVRARACCASERA